jgi:hypothetical protein
MDRFLKCFINNVKYSKCSGNVGVYDSSNDLFICMLKHFISAFLQSLAALHIPKKVGWWKVWVLVTSFCGKYALKAIAVAVFDTLTALLMSFGEFYDKVLPFSHSSGSGCVWCMSCK